MRLIDRSICNQPISAALAKAFKNYSDPESILLKTFIWSNAEIQALSIKDRVHNHIQDRL